MHRSPGPFCRGRFPQHRIFLRLPRHRGNNVHIFTGLPGATLTGRPAQLGKQGEMDMSELDRRQSFTLAQRCCYRLSSRSPGHRSVSLRDCGASLASVE
jgi:hypothetical protein